MNLSEQLMAENSRRNTDYIAQHIGNNPDLFRDLINVLFGKKPSLSNHASWVVTAITDLHPEQLKPYLKKIIDRIEKFDHTGIHRSLLRSLAKMNIPEALQGKLFDICYRWLQSRVEPPAVKVHCMQILFNLSENEPDLRKEIKLIIEELTDHESAAIKSRSRQLMKKMGGK